MSDAKNVVQQEQLRFVRSIIDCLEVNIDFDPDVPQTNEDKIRLRQEMAKFKIFVIDDFDGGMKIFVDNDLIGEWKKCKFKLKEDTAERDIKKKLYMEMEVNLWSVFEK